MPKTNKKHKKKKKKNTYKDMMNDILKSKKSNEQKIEEHKNKLSTPAINPSKVLKI
tara:strand:+ start:67 stop:234 length:168 start_codon:yes stop_codon:yes gene_type:complete